MKIFPKIILTFAAAVLSSQLSYSQTQTITGRALLLDSIPVSNISVSADKAKTETVTDSLGFFRIDANMKDKLVFKSKSFATRVVKINGETSDLKVDIVLPETEEKINLAQGYGYISEEARTSCIQAYKMKNDYSQYTSIFELIRAKFSNISISSSGCIIVRGVGTINSDPCAIFIVNGNQQDNIDWISPIEVKDISLLKDGSASIYGARGANGVFIINLKDGNE